MNGNNETQKMLRHSRFQVSGLPVKSANHNITSILRYSGVKLYFEIQKCISVNPVTTFRIRVF